MLDFSESRMGYRRLPLIRRAVLQLPPDATMA